MQEHLIVDGYNMIGAWPELARLKEISLEEARDRLIDMLADYQAYTGTKVIVVFDAYRVPGIGGKYEQSKVQIRYTKEKETADEMIERIVVSLIHRRRTIFVATSDMTEQHVVFGAGALRLPARELLVKIRVSRQELNRTIQEKGRSASTSGNTFHSRLSGEMKNLFEKWRRGE